MVDPQPRIGLEPLSSTFHRRLPWLLSGVVIIGSVGVNAGTKLVNNPQVPDIAEEYQRSFRVLRGLKCDVPLGSHPAMYSLAEKYPKLGKGPNPFIDPQGYKTELDIEETAFNTVLDAQKKAANESK